MAPAAVQTKQSVSAYSTSAPALFTHASMAGALTPSRSPITSTRFPLRFIVFLLSRLLAWIIYEHVSHVLGSPSPCPSPPPGARASKRLPLPLRGRGSG